MARYFTHPLLDDLGLKAIPHRVYSHLLRRAGTNGVCKTKAEEIAKVCRLDRKTVFASLSKLERLGLIRRWKRFQGCNHYHIPWPPIVGENGTIAVEETERQSWAKTEREVSLLKESQEVKKRGAAAVTDSASAPNGQSPPGTNAALPARRDVAKDALPMALEIREKEIRADPYGNFACFPTEDFTQWVQDWIIKIEQDGEPRNPQAALHGYLRKVVNRNSKKFAELHAGTEDGEPPF